MAAADGTWGNWEREHLFEKLLTPSDVGKLNRLVIPKQHAERHFPLDAGPGEKGFLLSFEDEGGKPWRFRYSYWTSSQSYVFTKGWSRYVKEKQLDAGDVVLFERRQGDGGDRLYIGWKRREMPINAHVVLWNNTTLYGDDDQLLQHQHQHQHHPLPPFCGSGQSPADSAMRRYSELHAGEERAGKNIQQTTSTWKKRVRLFGVNLECEMPTSTDPVVVTTEMIDPRELQLLPH